MRRERIKDKDAIVTIVQGCDATAVEIRFAADYIKIQSIEDLKF